LRKEDARAKHLGRFQTERREKKDSKNRHFPRLRKTGTGKEKVNAGNVYFYIGKYQKKREIRAWRKDFTSGIIGKWENIAEGTQRMPRTSERP